MCKSKKMCSILAVVLLVFVTTVFIYKDGLFYGNTKKTYESICKSSVAKAVPKSRIDLHRLCTCSYNGIYDLMGRGQMKRFVTMLARKNKANANAFLKEEGINIKALDSIFINCL